MANAEELRLVFKAETAAAVKDLKKAAAEIKKTKDTTKSLADTFKEQASKSLSAKNALLQLSSSVAGGMAIYNLASKGFQALTSFVRESGDAYRNQAAAERALEAAALNNPYLDTKNVASLKAYASELQKLTNTDDALAIKTMASLESLQLTEDQIKAVMTAAADYAAVTGKDLGSAAQQLAITYSGTLGTLGRMIPALKNLTKEQLAAGGAVEVFTKQYGGMAAAIAETDEGQIARLANAWGDFKEQVGRGAEEAFSPLRRSLAGFLEDLTNAMNWGHQVREAEDAVNAGGATLEQKLLAAEADLQEVLKKSNSSLFSTEKEALRLSAYIEALKETIKLTQSLEASVKAVAEESEAAAVAGDKADQDRATREAEAGKLYQNALDNYNESIAKLELEADLRGESVTAQERLNAAQKAYIDMITKSQGKITASGPSASAFKSAVGLPELSDTAKQETNQERITAILEKAKKAVDEYGLSQYELNLITLEKLGADEKQIRSYITSEAELSRMSATTEDAVSIVDSMTESLKDQIKSLAEGGLADLFAGVGEAMASGADAGDAAVAAVRNFAHECIRQVSSLAITAGLRVLAEQGTAGIPMALGLLALGGLTGIVGGMFGGGNSGSTGVVVTQTDYKKYISDPIVEAEKDNSRKRIEILKEQLNEEKKLRDDHIDKLEEEFDQEFSALKDLWDRNIISTEEYKSRGAALREAKYAAVGVVDNEYKEKETETNQAIETAEWEKTKNEMLYEQYVKLAAAKDAAAQKGTFLMPGADLSKRTLSGFTNIDPKALQEIATSQYAIDAIIAANSEEEMKAALQIIGGEITAYQGIEDARTEKIRLLTSEQQIYADAAAEEKEGINKAIYDSLVAVFRDRIQKAAAAETIDEIIAAREGIDFTTSGPRLLLVGDNPTGRERVQVTPLGSRNLNGPRSAPGSGDGATVNIYITGEVYGVEDLYARLDAAGKALARKGRL
jgi:hypothetical protein